MLAWPDTLNAYPYALNNPANLTDPSGEFVLAPVIVGGTLGGVIGTNTYVQSTIYGPIGRVDERTLGDDVLRTNYNYFLWTDANGWGRMQKIMTGTPADLDSLQDLRYTYDALGNVLTIKDYKAGSPQTQTFTYDALSRLHTAVASGGSGGTYASQTYSYSTTTGNLSSKAGVSYTYDTVHKHAVASRSDGSGFQYDANGNMTQRVIGGSTYNLTYDYENHLTGVSGAKTATFLYDGDGNRVKGTVDANSTAYIGAHFEWNTDTTNMKKYYYAGGVRVAMRTGSYTPKYLLTDHLGSTTINATYDGTLNGEKRYMPWGEERYTNGTTPTTYLYTGRREEYDLGIYFYQSRWYDPYLNRLSSPITFVLSCKSCKIRRLASFLCNFPARDHLLAISLAQQRQPVQDGLLGPVHAQGALARKGEYQPFRRQYNFRASRFDMHQ